LAKDKNKKVQGELTIDVLEKQLFKQNIVIVPAIYTLIIKIFAVLLGLSVIFLIYRAVTKIKRHDH